MERKLQKNVSDALVMDQFDLIASLFGVEREVLDRYVGEAEKIDRIVEGKIGGLRLWALGRTERVALYCVARAVDPELAVETGVGSGVSTTYILSALRRGVLHSFDLGVKYGDEEKAYPVGFAVPEELKAKWRLHLGDSKTLLQPFFESLGAQRIQLFLHDGEHTYQNVLVELTLAWEHMDSGAIFVDNYDWTEAPKDFCTKFGVKLYPLVEDLCVIAKMR